MPITPSHEPIDQPVELGRLLANTIASVVQAQEQLDAFRLEPTGQPKLVQIEGNLGVFTPVTDPGKTEETEQNLRQVVQVLQDEVARLQSNNLELQKRIKQIGEAQHRTPDDFASAIGHTVDSLQTRLYETKNPVSRFALKELEIEEIQGIGVTYQRKLNEKSIYSLSDLLNAGTRVRSQVELAAMLGVDRNKLAVWLSHAELMTVEESEAARWVGSARAYAGKQKDTAAAKTRE